MEQLNVSFDMAEAKLSITKETKSTIPSVTLLATTPMLSHPPPPPYRVDALAHKNRRLSPPYQIPSAYSFIITLDLLAISALFGFPQPKYPNNLTQLSPTTSMRNPNTSGMASSGSSAEPSSDDLENFEGTANANVLRLLKLKTHECKELNALLLEANSERWRLDRQVKLNDADIRLAKQTNNSLHADCLRFDDRLQDLQRLEPKLDCANAEIQSLKNLLRMLTSKLN
ncbi:hypothetical protein PSHT_03184 [Puccinia striiformis]|uniref:Uncharacterized protein n=1 Tax=Puccinia striiformis TaxID=27350 RepID=A0A2S4WG37_9BASI|nr:hypothetical protein PSHT_03184 [Puccinia striiformis]